MARYGDKLLPRDDGRRSRFLRFDDDGAQRSCFSFQFHLVAGQNPRWQEANHNGALPQYGKGHFADRDRRRSGLDVSFLWHGRGHRELRQDDGLPDVFATAVGGNHLFHNFGNGKFTEITSAAGVDGDGDHAADWSSGCAWLDYDNRRQARLSSRANYVQGPRKSTTSRIQDRWSDPCLRTAYEFPGRISPPLPQRRQRHFTDVLKSERHPNDQSGHGPSRQPSRSESLRLI